MGSTAAGHKFGFNDVWFDSRGQAVLVVLLFFCISLKVLSLAILGWKACHDSALHWRIRHRRVDIQHRIKTRRALAWFMFADLRALKSIGGSFVNSVRCERVLNVLFLQGVSKHNMAFICDAFTSQSDSHSLPGSSKVASRWQCHPGVRTSQHRGFKICTSGVYFDQTNERKRA